MQTVKKVVLAYSGGLDTSVILKWLQDHYHCEVVTFTADIGQDEPLEPVKAKAKALGINEIFVEDLREEFARDFIFPMFRANTVYEGEYLLGTAISRPLIAKHLVRIANLTSSDAIAHGATGKGNDQVRMELGAYALNPSIRIIAPWREWDLTSREKLVAYAKAHGIPVQTQADGSSDYSMDANLLHISYEGGQLEDPWHTPDPSVWAWTVAPTDAPDEPQTIDLAFSAGDPVSINDEFLSPAALMGRLNEIGCRHGVGRVDLVENRYIGMKNRGCYETPGGTILLKAHRAMESITLDREVAHVKDDLMPRYARLIYNGYWWSPEREALQTLIDASQADVTGTVRLSVYKGGVMVLGRRSETHSLFAPELSTFEEDHGAYRQADAEGFIKLNALRLRVAQRLRNG